MILRTQTILIMALGSLMLTGCSIPYLYHSDKTLITHGDHTERFIYKGIDFGTGRDKDYKRGVIDGCTTSSGKYRKDHASFNTSTGYRTGWESGRLKCKH